MERSEESEATAGENAEEEEEYVSGPECDCPFCDAARESVSVLDEWDVESPSASHLKPLLLRLRDQVMGGQ